MLLIENRIIPFNGYKCMTVWPFVFMRSGYHYYDVDKQHEGIHGEQQKEVLPFAILLAAALALSGCGLWSLLALPLWFYWYVIEWGIRFLVYGNQWEAYRNICFEQEAFLHEREFGMDYYLGKRKHYAWIKYLLTKSFNRINNN